MTVKDVMTKGVECIRPAASVQQAARKMKSLDVDQLPVCDNNRIVGMITARDVAVVWEGCDPTMTTVQEMMTPEVYCHEDEEVRQAAELMRKEGVGRLVVLDRNERPVGVVSLVDLAVETRSDLLDWETPVEVAELAHS